MKIEVTDITEFNGSRAERRVVVEGPDNILRPLHVIEGPVFPAPAGMAECAESQGRPRIFPPDPPTILEQMALAAVLVLDGRAK